VKLIDENKDASEACNPMEPLNVYQRMHLQGTFDVNAPIEQESGEPLPSLATQWKLDAHRRYNGKSIGMR